jgi:hypothetical protein
MFKGTPSVAPGEFSRRVAALGGRENAFTAATTPATTSRFRPDRLEDVMRWRPTALPTTSGPTTNSARRSRWSRKSAACAPKTTRARCCTSSSMRQLRGLALPPPDRGLDERPGRHDARGRARLLPPLVRARPTPPWWWRAMWMWPRCARWPKSTTARIPRAPCRRASRAPSPCSPAMRRIESRRRPSRPMWRWPSRCRSSQPLEPLRRPRCAGADGAVGRAGRLQRRPAGPGADAGARPRGRQRRRRQRPVGRGPQLFVLDGVPARARRPSRWRRRCAPRWRAWPARA